MLDEQLGEAREALRAAEDAELLPRRLRGARGLDGAVDVVGVRLGDGRNRLTGRRVERLELAARVLAEPDELLADQHLERLAGEGFCA